jgi:hypothetical protein
MSVLAESTVRCVDGSFVWTEEGVEVRHPAADPVGAAQRIAARYRQPESSVDHSSEGHSPTDSAREQSG